MPDDDDHIDWLFRDVSMNDIQKEKKKREKELEARRSASIRHYLTAMQQPGWPNSRGVPVPKPTSKKKEKQKQTRRAANMPKENAMIDFIMIRQEKKKKDPWDDDDE